MVVIGKDIEKAKGLASKSHGSGAPTNPVGMEVIKLFEKPLKRGPFRTQSSEKWVMSRQLPETNRPAEDLFLQKPFPQWLAPHGYTNLD